jgi:ATP-dependent DNA helicase RecG
MKRSELLEIISNGENSGVEFKLDDIRPEQLAKEVVALANLKGGYILLGVADDKTIVGITRINLSEWVADTVFGRYIHPVILPYYEEVVMDSGKRVAVITIGQEVSKPYVVRANDRETAYVRIGAVSRPATREQLLMLGAASGAVHTEIMPVNRTSIASLDQVRLENYLRDILRDPEVPGEEESWVARLKALGFMTDGVADDPVCTIAGLVLFGIRPRQTLKQSGIRLMFFDSTDKAYQAQLDRIIDAPLVGRFQVGKAGKSLIDAGLIEKTLEAIEPFVTLEPNTIDENFRREKIWFYPYEALRELLINALTHRDWSRFVDVDITGYRDRLEIISPGALPNSMTVEKMLAGQRSARNHIIVEVLRDYGYVDARGMGVRTKVIPALKAGGVQFLFDAADDYVKVVVGKTSVKTAGSTTKVSVKRARSVGKASDKATSHVGKTSGKILAAIRDKAEITIPELADIVGVTQRSVERNLQKLQREGLLKRVGGRKHGYWEVAER